MGTHSVTKHAADPARPTCSNDAMRLNKSAVLVPLLVLGVLPGIAERVAFSSPSVPAGHGSGFVVEHDSSVAVRQPAPHRGGGSTTAYPFFSGVADLKLIFRKRALHPGSAIGYHLQDQDEIYYVLSGTGVMAMNGTHFPVGPGTAILTRTGSSHGLRQTGADDLVVLIVYEREAPRAEE